MVVEPAEAPKFTMDEWQTFARVAGALQAAPAATETPGAGNADGEAAGTAPVTFTQEQVDAAAAKAVAEAQAPGTSEASTTFTQEQLDTAVAKAVADAGAGTPAASAASAEPTGTAATPALSEEVIDGMTFAEIEKNQAAIDTWLEQRDAQAVGANGATSELTNVG